MHTVANESGILAEMEPVVLILMLLFIALLVSAVVFPIVALVLSIRTRNKLNQISATGQTPSIPGSVPQLPIAEANRLAARVRQLEARVATLETTLTGQSIPQPKFVEPQQTTPTAQPLEPLQPPAPVPVATPPQMPVAPVPHPIPVKAERTEQLESIIGRRWLGWTAVCVILFAAAFFLKYAFDNRWIGEVGRVAIGVAAGVSMTLAGYKYHRRGWRIFSQILSAGGIVLLYLSVYAAFGYYHLATQKAAFVFLAILVVEAAGLALLYEAPAIAIMALIGGFLSPILLRSDRDQYRSLFGYILALDLGALALLRHWPGLSSIAFAGTQFLFWLWYGEKYHPRKLVAVMVFQTIVFLFFLLAHIGKKIVRRQAATLEDLGLLVINPFVFFATTYFFLNPEHHDWMGALAIGMALVYAGAAKLLVDRAATTRAESLLVIGTALTFVTMAIPIQLRSNWITIAWAFEALVMLWAGIEIGSQRLRISAQALFALALIRLVCWDTPYSRPMFTPVLNKYFLSSLMVTACLIAAAFLYHRAEQRRQMIAPVPQLVIVLVAIVTLWIVMSVETYTFFAARAATYKLSEDYSHELWVGQMALSVLWSIYAGTLTAIGFIRRSAGIRWAALTLFAITVIKAMLVDIAGLQQLYRIIVFMVLGLLLLLVAWGYQKAFHSREATK